MLELNPPNGLVVPPWPVENGFGLLLLFPVNGEGDGAADPNGFGVAVVIPPNGFFEDA